MLKFFGQASKIEQKLERVPKNAKEIRDTALKLSYDKAEQDPEMAEIFFKYNAKEKVFNQCLELKPKMKDHDNLPDIHIDGKDIGHNAYHLVKLPAKDPRAFILGDITNCCQSIGGNSEKCVLDGVSLENNGFYVLLKGKGELYKNNKLNYQNFDIVGQGYAWKTQNDNLVFDSWENLRPQTETALNDDGVIVDFLSKFAQEATTNHQIARISIGCGGKTPKIYQDSAITEYPKEGYFYGDASIQANIADSSELKALKEENQNVSHFVSVKQLKEFMAIDADLRSDLMKHENYKILTGQYFLPESNMEEFYSSLLQDKDKNKINALTSEDARDCYKVGVKVSDLKDLELDKIKALILNGVPSYCYRAGVKVSELKDLELNKIKALTLLGAANCYKAGIKVSELQDFELDKIKALTSYGATACYKAGAKVSELKDLELKKIKALTSYEAADCYRAGAKLSELKDLELKKIKALTSLRALNCYMNGVKVSDLIKEIKKEKQSSFSIKIPTESELSSFSKPNTAASANISNPSPFSGAAIKKGPEQPAR